MLIVSSRRLVKAGFLFTKLHSLLRHNTNLFNFAFSEIESLSYSSLGIFLEDTFLASMQGLEYLRLRPRSETLATMLCFSSSSILA